MRWLSILLLVPGSVPALAGDRIDTPSGLAVISGEPFALVLTVGGTEFLLPGEAQFAMFEDRIGNRVLVQMSPGGNACAGFFFWLDTTPGAIAVSEAFGTCSDRHEVSEANGTVTVTMPYLEPGRGVAAYSWNGDGSVVERELGLAASGQPPGSDPSGWIGRHPYELLNSADWEPLLTQLTGAGMLARLRGTMEISSGFERQGAWVVGLGMARYGGDRAALALGPDGAVLIAFRPEGGQGQVWGAAPAALPPAIAGLLQ